jgi:hypothetical protein
VGAYPSGGGPLAFGAISYPIPLEKPSENVVYLDAAETEASAATPVQGCSYDAEDPEAVPVAPPGTLCVFTRLESAGEVSFIGAAGTDWATGTYVLAETEGEGVGAVNVFGAWAVTAK